VRESLILRGRPVYKVISVTATVRTFLVMHMNAGGPETLCRVPGMGMFDALVALITFLVLITFTTASALVTVVVSIALNALITFAAHVALIAFASLPLPLVR
jgi:hypothetical protein